MLPYEIFYYGIFPHLPCVEVIKFGSIAKEYIDHRDGIREWRGKLMYNDEYPIIEKFVEERIQSSMIIRHSSGRYTLTVHRDAILEDKEIMEYYKFWTLLGFINFNMRYTDRTGNTTKLPRHPDTKLVITAIKLSQYFDNRYVEAN